MAGNPMQRKARNYFILGLVIAGVIGAIGVGFLAYKIYNKEDGYQAKIKELNGKFEKKYYALVDDVKAMEELTGDDLVMVTTVKGESTAPEDYMTPDMLEIEEVDEDGNPILDKDGNPRYVYPYHAATDLKAGTILGESMLYQQEVSDDLRLVEYNVLALNSQAQSGDVVDVRMKLPSGADLIVLSKKLIKIPQIADLDAENTVWLNLTEDEILLMSSAIVECYMIDGAYLYTTNYISANQQAASTGTYAPNQATITAMVTDTNVVETAYKAMVDRFQTGKGRELVDAEKYKDPEKDDIERQEDAAKGLEEEVKKAQQGRKKYLDSLEE